MNHRELVLSARKKAKFYFLQLPEELQDEVVDKLDGQELTLEAARDYLKECGHSLSHEAIAAYYRAVRRERRIYDATQELTRVVDQFQDQPLEENVRCLTNFLIATAVRKISDGEVGIKDVDLARVIGAMSTLRQAEGDKGQGADEGSRKAEGGEQGADGGGKPVDRKMDPETIRKVREEIYGLV